MEWPNDGSIQPPEKLQWLRCWAVRFGQLLRFFAAHGCPVPALHLFRNADEHVAATSFGGHLRRCDVFVAIDYFDQFFKHKYMTQLYAGVCTRAGGVMALARTDGLSMMASLNLTIDIRRRCRSPSVKQGGEEEERDDLAIARDLFQETIAQGKEADEHNHKYSGPRPRRKRVPSNIGKGWTDSIIDESDPICRHPEYVDFKAEDTRLNTLAQTSQEVWQTHCSQYMAGGTPLFCASGLLRCQWEFFKNLGHTMPKFAALLAGASLVVVGAVSAILWGIGASIYSLMQ